MTRRSAAAVAAWAAIVACNRERAHEPPRSSSGSPAADATWVARPAELAPEQVRAVQQALEERGFPVDASGTLDGRTRTAIADFQRSRGLPTTGNVNAETADALGLDPVAMMPRREGELPGEPLPGDEPETRPSRDAGDR